MGVKRQRGVKLELWTEGAWKGNDLAGTGLRTAPWPQGLGGHGRRHPGKSLWLVQQCPLLAPRQPRHTLLPGSDPASLRWGKGRASGTSGPPGVWVRGAWMRQKTWVLPLPSCVTSGGSLPFSEPHCFPHFSNGGKESFLLTSLLWSEHTWTFKTQPCPRIVG